MNSDKKGLFIVFEGIDGSGTSTQVIELMKEIEDLDKYQDVIRTHEPWKSEDIKRKLEQDRDAYSDPEETAQLFVGDRTDHSYRLVDPNLCAGVIVVCSRYELSTCAFQQAQGVPLEKLIRMHQNRGIITPDMTFLLDVEREAAAQRMQNRERQEKFERDAGFIEKVIENYRKLEEISKKYPDLFGSIIKINANAPLKEVTAEVYENFLPPYNRWSGREVLYSGHFNLGKTKSKPSIESILQDIKNL